MKLTVSQLRTIIKEEVRAATVNRRLEEAIERELQALVAEGIIEEEGILKKFGRSAKNAVLAATLAAGGAMGGGTAHAAVRPQPGASATSNYGVKAVQEMKQKLDELNVSKDPMDHEAYKALKAVWDGSDQMSDKVYKAVAKLDGEPAWGPGPGIKSPERKASVEFGNLLIKYDMHKNAGTGQKFIDTVNAALRK